MRGKYQIFWICWSQNLQVWYFFCSLLIAALHFTNWNNACLRSNPSKQGHGLWKGKIGKYAKFSAIKCHNCTWRPLQSASWSLDHCHLKLNHLHDNGSEKDILKIMYYNNITIAYSDLLNLIIMLLTIVLSIEIWNWIILGNLQSSALFTFRSFVWLHLIPSAWPGREGQYCQN